MLQRVSLQMFKYSRNTLPEVIHELFITNDTFHSRNTRNKNKLRSKMSNREYMYKNFSFIGVVEIPQFKITNAVSTGVYHVL